MPTLGVLCGRCQDDKGVSALLNHCVSCHDASGLLIALLSKPKLHITCEIVTCSCLHMHTLLSANLMLPSSSLALVLAQFLMLSS